MCACVCVCVRVCVCASVAPHVRTSMSRRNIGKPILPANTRYETMSSGAGCDCIGMRLSRNGEMPVFVSDDTCVESVRAKEAQLVMCMSELAVGYKQPNRTSSICTKSEAVHVITESSVKLTGVEEYRQEKAR